MNVLDIVAMVSRELRYCPSFVALLHDCDEDTIRRITREYLEWINRMLDEANGPQSEPH